ncbi:MAG: FAD-dependent oxidoreductase [Pseudomonadota bacterium]
MARDPRYDILFEPIQIGPVTAPNRFYQAPHATGMGYTWPNHARAYRAMKAEGGWGVINTEECMIHPSSDHMASPHMRLWSDDDIPAMVAQAEAVHAHGALFGVELAHAGRMAANRLTRERPLAPSLLPYAGFGPYVAKPMDKADIAAFRGWHKDAAERAIKAGADIVYVYAAHDLSLPMQFLLPRYNQRTDEYGGPLVNRMRLLREVLEDTREVAEGRAAVALRFAVDEMAGPDGLQHDGEAPEVIAALAEMPDLWDVNVSDWSNDSGMSRFFEEGYQDPYTAFVKTLTTKPVVGVGRYTSPDRMVSLLRKGHLDLIGAARPTIADPFLPNKIKEGRIDDIRECIGCNMCTTNVLLGAPIRCTQNPTIGAEWSRGWHPEVITAATARETVLVIGGGPAGLEAALTLARKGHEVMLSDASQELGGRVILESGLPGLSAWRRVADYRVYQLSQMPNVQLFPGQRLSATDVLEMGIPHVAVAEGATWRRTGEGRVNMAPIAGWNQAHVYSSSDVMAGAKLSGDVFVFDDEHYYMGSVIAEKLARDGCSVTLVTPAAELGSWSKFTLEFQHVQARMAALGVTIKPSRNIARITQGGAILRANFTGEEEQIDEASIVMVTSAAPNTVLRDALEPQRGTFAEAGIESLSYIGDCVAPGPIAQAVHDGHLFARDFGTTNAAPLRVEPIGQTIP